MGANESTARSVSFGMGEDEKVTVIEGVKLSQDVLRRMKESHGTVRTKDQVGPPVNHEKKACPHPQGPTTTEIQEEIRKNFERQQALVQEQLDKLAQREKEAVATAGLNDPIIAKGMNYEEEEKVKMLARQLERKEVEMARISTFYKDQLEKMEKKNIDDYKAAVQQYDQTAAKAETHISPVQTAPMCTELQAKVLQCYKDHPEQTLHCSTLAKEYMTCVQQARTNLLTNHS